MTHCISDLLAVLRAAQASHQHAHWTCKGTQFYADHLLFQRLYESITDEFDTLAEKAVQQAGAKSVDLCEQLKSMLECAKEWDTDGDLVRRALDVEKAVQWEIQVCRGQLEKDDALTPGMDNFLAQLADNHETALYLLGQRLGGKP